MGFTAIMAWHISGSYRNSNSTLRSHADPAIVAYLRHEMDMYTTLGSYDAFRRSSEGGFEAWTLVSQVMERTTVVRKKLPNQYSHPMQKNTARQGFSAFDALVLAPKREIDMQSLHDRESLALSG